MDTAGGYLGSNVKNIVHGPVPVNEPGHTGYNNMTSWLKQGLSTLGEGLATLTKEIITEDPVEFPRPAPSASPSASVDISSNHVLQPIEDSEYARLRSLVQELEERAQNAENLISTNSLHYQQLIKNHENHLVVMRDQIYDLQSQLEDAKRMGPIQMDLSLSNGPVENERQNYVEVDLTASSPSPQRNEDFSLSSEVSDSIGGN